MNSRRALLMLLLAAWGGAAQTPEPIGQLVDIGGYRLHLYCTGTGSPTVMVAGAGYSFDWGLVQPQVARFARVCTYDPSGMAWSDPGKGGLNCRGRVKELRTLIEASRLEEPLVLVGLSIGACYARLYAQEYPAGVAGMVIVDHAFSPDPPPARTPPTGADTPPVLIRQTPIEVGVEQISAFENLPERLRALHRWAASLHPQLPSWESAEDCLAQLNPAPYPLADLPLVVISTENQARGYDRLQKNLLALSHASSQMIASRSFHAVEIDQPGLVIAAIRRVVDQVRSKR